jgi:hypothetical protein
MSRKLLIVPIGLLSSVACATPGCRMALRMSAFGNGEIGLGDRHGRKAERVPMAVSRPAAFGRGTRVASACPWRERRASFFGSDRDGTRSLHMGRFNCSSESLPRHQCEPCSCSSALSVVRVFETEGGVI